MISSFALFISTKFSRSTDFSSLPINTSILLSFEKPRLFMSEMKVFIFFLNTSLCSSIFSSFSSIFSSFSSIFSSFSSVFSSIFACSLFSSSEILASIFIRNHSSA